MSDCVLWTGPISSNGYGLGRSPARPSACTGWRGKRFTGLSLSVWWFRHKCDVRACINVEHLELGTHLDNMNDRNVRGRQARGERQGHSVLTADAVRSIRDRYSHGELQVALATEYGVHQTTVSDIVRRKSWQHISTEKEHTCP